ncbi:MAG: hypothetical protein ACI8Z7_000645 [Candidatus Nanohaloarchaea archaeon]|jgi:hypothetical protein
MYRHLLARFVNQYEERCPFEDEVEWCPGELRVEDIDHTPEKSDLRKSDPNLVWHHLDDEKEKANNNWRKVAEIEDPDDVVLAHRYCHNVHNANDHF